jgi:hypothetical protein
LLRALRAPCPATARFSQTAADAFDCSGDAACADAFAAARAGARRVAEAARGADRAVRATRLPPACKRALVTPAAAYAGLEELDSAVGALQRALRSDAADDDGVAATRVLRAAGRRSAPSARVMLDRLRRGCH